jgi:tetratricopeptide (TPR) repeat protein
VGSILANVAIGVAASLIAAAPLAVGGVHRPAMILLMVTASVCMGALCAGLALQGRSLRVGTVVLVPAAFMLIPLLQSIPLPLSIRGVFDGAGTALLRDNDVATHAWWPLSLDPPATRVYVGRAAVALVIFLVAYHLASGQTRRHLLARVVACAGLAAVVIGIGHRIFAVSKVYGLFNTSARALITGPFVNVNHTAELLELATFVCLALSFQRETALNRIGWLVGTFLCAGGALATLSRGSVVAMVIGLVVFASLRYFAPDASGVRHRRASLAWAGLVLAVIVFGAAVLGASQLVDRFKTDTVGTDVRFHLWRDSLRVFVAHPFGIGRGAFDRVFPIYREFRMPFAVRFAFVENQPLQLLIDCGWFFFLLLAGAVVVLVGWRTIRHGRRDKTEAALLAGLIAVLAHNLLDFGLETLGVLIPFTAIVGTLLGRLKAPEPPARITRARWGIAATAAACAVLGAAATAHRSNDDFDAMLKHVQSSDARRALLARAEQTHPLDYLYALGQARLLPLKGDPGVPSPRFQELNRALRLCPRCETAHVEVARNLWKLGLRRQALLEWRTAVDIQPAVFNTALPELLTAGAKPEEVAAVTSTDVWRMLQLVSLLASRERVKEAFVVLDQADALGAERGEVLLARAALQMKVGQLEAAGASVAVAVNLGLQDPRLAVLRARLLIAEKHAEGADAALAILEQAAARNPSDMDVQQQRIDLIVEYRKWNLASRALEGYKLALFRRYGSATYAHVYGARIEGQLGHWNRSLDEYRIALADRATDVPLWVEYAHAAENAGRDSIARDAYAHAAHLSPGSPDVVKAQQALEARAVRLRGPEPDAPQRAAP